MLTLLLGTDLIAKKNHLKTAAKQRGADMEIYTESSALPNFDALFEPQLFGPPKVVVLDGLWKKFSDEDIERLLQSVANPQATVFVLEESLDKRKKVNQEFLKNESVKVIQLDAPVGMAAAGSWINSFAKENNISIDGTASMALAKALLIDEDSTLDTLRAQNELAKLGAYAGSEKITVATVEKLTEKEIAVDIFELLNAIAAKNKKQALHVLNQYFETETTDEKANAIKVSALLADQFRSLLLAHDATTRSLQDAQVLDMTGWKSGRLFMMKKLSRNFTASQLKRALGKLENLDRELKTGSMPPHVVLDLIISDM